MKKFLAILLAMMLALVSVVALTEGETTEGGATQVVSIDPATASGAAGTPTKPVQVKITKSITAEDVYNDADKHPAVTLTFTAVEKSVELSTETTAPEVKFEELTIAEGAGSGDLKINLPSYKAVGIYTYTVTETATNIAGITEATNLELKVTVIQNGENLEIAGIAIRQDDVKTDDIENEYKSGRLKVTKIVEGNMGDRTKEFPITITLKAPKGKTVASTVTYTINGKGTATKVDFSSGTATVKVNLKHNDYVEIANLPEGVTYSFVEDDTITHLTKSDEEQTNKNAYLVEGENSDDTEITVKDIAEEKITNTKDIVPDTGVTLETLPYVLMMALVMFGFVALKLRKREEY